MKKIIYWLSKVGIIRTASYKVSGDARKLNEINANDGGMMQSQEEIDEKHHYSKSKKSKKAGDKGGSDSKVSFWIFLVVGLVLFLLILLMEVVVFAFVFSVFWGLFLRSIWKKSSQGKLLVGKTLVIGLVSLVAVSIVALIIMPTDDKGSNDAINNNLKNTNQVQTEQRKKSGVSFSSDNVSQFLMKLESSLEINFDDIMEDDNLVWVNGGAGLKLNGSKKVIIKNLSDKKWQSLQKYFENKGGTTGTIGMKFVGDKNQMGYYFTKKGTGYYMLMCVATKEKTTTTISCGWGPGGGK